MNDVRISVVIPTCHRNDLLALCLDRLAPGAQTLDAGRYEVIVTDDGRETTAESVVIERYPWARWVAGPRRGPAANRNHGAAQASGAWLAFTDDDCLPAPGWLAAYAGAVQAGVQVYEGRTTCEAGLTSPLSESPINLAGGRLWSCNFLVCPRLFAGVGGFDEDFTMPSMEDTDFRERLRARGEETLFVAGAVVDHPPRRKPFGPQAGRKYEANVQYWYKTGGRGRFLIPFLKHVKCRLHALLPYCRRPDVLAALWSVIAESGYIAAHLPQWERKYRARYQPPSHFIEGDPARL